MTDGSGAILVVDDDLDFRDLLVEHLVSRGHSVEAAGNGAEALAALEARAKTGDAFAMILLDLRMPVMDGFEFCRRVKDVPALDHIPIAVMTAEHETRNVTAAPSVIAVLHKPLELDRLDAMVARHVGR